MNHIAELLHDYGSRLACWWFSKSAPRVVAMPHLHELEWLYRRWLPTQLVILNACSNDNFLGSCSCLRTEISSLINDLECY